MVSSANFRSLTEGSLDVQSLAFSSGSQFQSPMHMPPPPRSAHFVCFSYRFRRLFYSNVKCPAKWTSQDIPPLFQFEANVYVPCKVH